MAEIRKADEWGLSARPLSATAHPGLPIRPRLSPPRKSSSAWPFSNMRVTRAGADSIRTISRNFDQKPRLRDPKKS